MPRRICDILFGFDREAKIMKSIQIGQDHFLHVYLIKHSHVSDDLDGLWESDSAEAEVGFDPEQYYGGAKYNKAAQDLIDAMAGRYCASTLMNFIEVFSKTLLTEWHDVPWIVEPQYQFLADYVKAREAGRASGNPANKGSKTETTQVT